jgi:hypothetical protein
MTSQPHGLLVSAATRRRTPKGKVGLLSRQTYDKLLEYGFRLALDLLAGLVLDGVFDVDGVKVRSTERGCLRPGRQYKFGRRDRHGRDI